MRIKESNEKLGESLKNNYNWLLVWTVIILLIISCIISWGKQSIDFKEVTAYVGQEVRFYSNLDKSQIYIPGSCYVCNDTQDYIGIIATETGNHNIKVNNKTVLSISVKEGNNFDSYVTFQKDDSNLSMLLTTIVGIIICFLIWSIPVIIIIIIRKSKKKKCS